MFTETATAFRCEGELLIGILGIPDAPKDVAVVIVVGGPQYRVGSHRQFVALARHLTRHGYATLRFDYRGMGDSTGEARGFEDVDADIRAAIDHAVDGVPGIRRVVLWGLCDAASAVMMYAPSDVRVAGLVVANPWVRSEQSYAKTMLTHYYVSRLFSRAFWQKLGSRKLDIRNSTTELLGTVASSAKQRPTQGDFRVRMRRAMDSFSGRTLFLISEHDLTAREFEAYAAAEMQTAFALPNARNLCLRIAGADHTFSGSEASIEAAKRTLGWLQTSFPASSQH